MDEWRMRGSQIPAFGNWDYVNELPITQYFECARQAGLIRYSSSSGECDHPHNHNNNSVKTVSRPKQGKGGEEKRSGGTNVREASRKQAGKVFDVTVTELPQPHVAKRHPAAVKKKHQQFEHDAGCGGAQPRSSGRVPKPVDEDLYKISPDLLKRKRRLGFISRCLVPPCAV